MDRGVNLGMNLGRRLGVWLGVGILIIGGCEQSDTTAPPVTPAVQTPASPRPGAAGPEAIDPATTAHEARVQAMARDLNARAADHLRDMKVGEEAVLIVRGDAQGGTIYGSGPYTQDSRIGRAAIHAGLLTDGELGLLRVRMLKHEGDHPAVERHGIRPNAWGPYYASYTLERIDRPSPVH